MGIVVGKVIESWCFLIGTQYIAVSFYSGVAVSSNLLYFLLLNSFRAGMPGQGWAHSTRPHLHTPPNQQTIHLVSDPVTLSGPI